MTIAFRVDFRLLRRLASRIWVATLLIGVMLPKAHAGSVSPYALTDFSLFNSAGANGEASSPDRGATLMLIGSHDGSGATSGITTLTILSRAAGLFEFDSLYTSLEDRDSTRLRTC